MTFTVRAVMAGGKVLAATCLSLGCAVKHGFAWVRSGVTESFSVTDAGGVIVFDEVTLLTSQDDLVDRGRDYRKFGQ